MAQLKTVLMVQAAGSSEMLVIIYQTIWHHMPEDNNFHIHRCEKPQILLTYLCVASSSNLCIEDHSCSDDRSASFKASKLHATSEKSLQTHKNIAILVS